MGRRREKSTKGQASFEYLLITAFAFLLLLPIIIIAYSQSAAFSGDVTAAQLQKVGNQIVDAANSLYYSGPPAKRTLRLYMPEGVNSILISNTTLVFNAQGKGGSYDYAVFADTNMTGDIAPFSGMHTITLLANDNVVTITDG